MTKYYVGQIFIGTYPDEVAGFCDEHNYYLADLEPTNGERRFEIKEIEPYIPTQEEIDKFTMTAWDFVGVLKQCGLTSAQIMDFLNSNPDIQLHLTCCKDVFCGVAKSLMPITYEGITITVDMVEQAFKNKYGVE